MPAAPYARILLWTLIAAALAAFVWMAVQRLRTGAWRLPLWRRAADRPELPRRADPRRMQDRHHAGQHLQKGQRRRRLALGHRSDEHTSELQSLMRNSYAVCCLK